MAQLSRWAIFVRAFLIALMAGAPAQVANAVSDEVAAWASAEQADTTQAYYSYLSRFPTGEYVDRAIAALIRLGAISQGPKVRQLPPSQVQRQPVPTRPKVENPY